MQSPWRRGGLSSACWWFPSFVTSERNVSILGWALEKLPRSSASTLRTATEARHEVFLSPVAQIWPLQISYHLQFSCSLGWSEKERNTKLKYAGFYEGG